MNSGSREWSKAERREVLLMAILPVAGAAVLTALLFASHPALWLFAFGVSTACAYVSMFVGVMPLLWLSRRFDRRCWYDYAASGFLGTLLPWLAITLVFRRVRAEHWCRVGSTELGDLLSSAPGGNRWRRRSHLLARVRPSVASAPWHLTPPSSGQPKGRFAPFGLPLMSNVRAF